MVVCEICQVLLCSLKPPESKAPIVQDQQSRSQAQEGAAYITTMNEGVYELWTRHPILQEHCKCAALNLCTLQQHNTVCYS